MVISSACRLPPGPAWSEPGMATVATPTLAASNTTNGFKNLICSSLLRMPRPRADIDGFNQALDRYSGAGCGLFNHSARGRLEDAKERVFSRHQGRFDERHVNPLQPEFLRHPGGPITGSGQLVGGQADRIAFDHKAGHILLP